jgi:4-hydroxy-tetrahydrodipicolinate reductase
MNIALIGYGKMGKAIEEIAVKRGHSVTVFINSKNLIENADFSLIDVAIEFTRPELALHHIDFCITNNVPLVVGTTGWYDEIPQIEKKVLAHKAAMIYASNFSLGVNLFFELNNKLASLMNPYSKEYMLSMEEIHHTQKLDSPSGTAISLAKDIIKEGNYTSYHTIDDNNGVPSKKETEFDIIAKRIPEVSGTHSVVYESDIDKITITHQAKNRMGFALGSIIAAEWLENKKGLFTMKDVLKL